jgi:hypothetical protein
MANRNDGLALDLDLFDNTKNGYVPVERKKKKLEIPTVINPKPISFEQAKTEVRASRIAALRAGLIAIAALLILGSLIYRRERLSKPHRAKMYACRCSSTLLCRWIKLRNMLRQSSAWLSVKAIR